jgi:hypothetical protein
VREKAHEVEVCDDQFVSEAFADRRRAGLAQRFEPLEERACVVPVVGDRCVAIVQDG